MRQRTKVGESIEVQVGGFAYWIWTDQHYPIDVQIGEARERAKASGGKVVKVTRYRLAPLVVLPAWHAPTMCPTTMCTSDEPEIFAEYFQKMGIWVALVEFNGDEHITEHATADEARAACEKRLRELGYRVARATKAGAT